MEHFHFTDSFFFFFSAHFAMVPVRCPLLANLKVLRAKHVPAQQRYVLCMRAYLKFKLLHTQKKMRAQSEKSIFR